MSDHLVKRCLPDFFYQKVATFFIVVNEETYRRNLRPCKHSYWSSLVAQIVKNLPAMQETWVWDLGSIPGLGRYPGEGNGYPLQYSGLENSMDCIVHWVTKSWTRLSNFHFTLPPFHLVPPKSSPAIIPTPSGISSTPKLWHQGVSNFWGLMKVIATCKKGFVGEILG